MNNCIRVFLFIRFLKFSHVLEEVNPGIAYTSSRTEEVNEERFCRLNRQRLNKWRLLKLGLCRWSVVYESWKGPFQVRVSIRHVGQRMPSRLSSGHNRRRRWSVERSSVVLMYICCFCAALVFVNLVVSRSAIAAFGKHLETGCGLVEGRLKTDTDRTRCNSIYTPYEAPPYRLSKHNHAPPGSASLFWDLVGQPRRGYLTHVDKKGVFG